MDDDYYGYHSSVVLRRPLVLTAVATDVARRYGYWIAATEGLPFVDLDRRIEHSEGESLWSILESRGETYYRAVEAACLDVALRARPASVVVGGDGLPLAPTNRTRLQADAHWVVFAAGRDRIADELRRASHPTKGFWHPTRREVLMDPTQIDPFYADRVAAMAEAPIHIDIDRHASKDVRRQLLAELPVA